jgi:zinc protease
MARWYGAALASGATVEAVKGWPDRIRAVTADQVRAAARDWLKAQRSVTGYLVKELPTSDAKAPDARTAGEKTEKKS